MKRLVGSTNIFTNGKHKMQTNVHTYNKMETTIICSKTARLLHTNKRKYKNQNKLNNCTTYVIGKDSKLKEKLKKIGQNWG